MAAISLAVNDVVIYKYSSTKGYYFDANERTNLKPEDTYFIVFGPTQDKHEEWFVNRYADKIIYKSKKAFNSNYKPEPRNTLYVFEI